MPTEFLRFVSDLRKDRPENRLTIGPNGLVTARGVSGDSTRFIAEPSTIPQAFLLRLWNRRTYLQYDGKTVDGRGIAANDRLAFAQANGCDSVIVDPDSPEPCEPTVWLLEPHEQSGTVSLRHARTQCYLTVAPDGSVDATLECEPGSHLHLYSFDGEVVTESQPTGFWQGLKVAASSAAKVFEQTLLYQDSPWKQRKFEHTITQLRDLLEGRYGPDVEQLRGGIIVQLSSPPSPLHADVTAFRRLVALAVQQLFAQTSDFRELHQKFLEKLRAVVSSPLTRMVAGYDPVPIEYLITLDLCYHKISQVQMYTFTESLVSELLRVDPNYQQHYEAEVEVEEAESNVNPGANDDDEENKQEILQRLQLSHSLAQQKKVEAQFQAVSAAPLEYGKKSGVKSLFGKIRREGNLNFDPQQQGNLPYVLYDVDLVSVAGTPFTLRALRIGTPTMEKNLITEAQIVPEFLGYLAQLDRLQKRHLYVSLQQPRGNEGNRTRSILDLAVQVPCFYAVVLNNDCEFYKQSRSDADEKAGDFFQNLEDFIFNSTDCTIPPKIDRTNLIPLTRDLVAEIHLSIFNSRPLLSVEDRKDFIEIFYALFSLLLARYLHTSMMNISCKDAIDRAGKTNALLFHLLTTLTGNAATRRYARILTTFTHAPAFFVQKRAILPARRKRLVSARRRLDNAIALRQIALKAEVFGIAPAKRLEVQEWKQQHFTLSRAATTLISGEIFKAGNWTNAWKCRQFQLTPDGVLSYYRAKEDETPAGHWLVSTLKDGFRPIRAGSLEVTLIFGREPVRLKFRSQDDLDAWRSAIYLAKEQKPVDPVDYSGTSPSAATYPPSSSSLPSVRAHSPENSPSASLLNLPLQSQPVPSLPDQPEPNPDPSSPPSPSFLTATLPAAPSSLTYPPANRPITMSQELSNPQASFFSWKAWFGGREDADESLNSSPTLVNTAATIPLEHLELQVKQVEDHLAAITFDLDVLAQFKVLKLQAHVGSLLAQAETQPAGPGRDRLIQTLVTLGTDLKQSDLLRLVTETRRQTSEFLTSNVADPHALLIHRDKLHDLLQHLDELPPAAPGSIITPALSALRPALVETINQVADRIRVLTGFQFSPVL